MTQTVAICIQKGGVGKTTLTINLGSALADLGKKVLLIDLDPQGHLTEGVGLKDLYLEEKPGMFEYLTSDSKDRPAVSDLIYRSPTESLSVIPSTYQMMLAEQKLYMSRNREHKLKHLPDQLSDQFDWILIDCPPNLGNLTDNALNTARQAIVPIQAEATSVRALELLLDQIESIERALNIHVRVLAVVPNLVQSSNMSHRILSDLRQSVPMVTTFELPKRVLLQTVWEQGRSIFTYEPDNSSNAKVKEEVMASYRQLAKYLINQVGGNTHDR